ncbi:hypothetical protein M409DRAFT_65109 [Zasmidium cellare ATCC 36951]|uniref:Zn(2)-C6 fungal-type domain-containing protein n=1 Tax=Zasmidium cellare ATCC 36951 TaxID=1080233 RepID=A0A6A6CQV1_ZASCE|nr:uncharacterized protein M409DRAFT_65109 [Zasmidium cellare ATCC 36951]KAF2169451.1 hypothetical protein M409DRAFT_65109 [Zasmidium cellare ATCC 36951]
MKTSAPPVRIEPATTPPASASAPTAVTLDRLGRQRVQRACRACKWRKRKCNGEQPCRACLRGEYECSYSTPERQPKPRGRPRTFSQSQTQTQSKPAGSTSHATESAIAGAQAQPGSLTEASPATLPSTRDSNVVANSGTVFARILGLQLGAEPAALHVQALGWNLDLRPQPRQSEKSIVWITSPDDWQTLFDSFVHHVHPLYGFLDLDAVTKTADRRWRDPGANNVYDHVLCGIAALGSVFNGHAGAYPQEEHLVDCAREMCEHATSRAKPDVSDVEAWLLRTLYLRCCKSPHAAWMASCTAVHMAEGVGLHQEAGNVSIVYDRTSNLDLDIDRQRRLFWLATLLNTWISNEYGRSAVSLENVTCQMPAMVVDDPTTDLLNLFTISESLGPAKEASAETIKHCLVGLDEQRFKNDALVLSQCNLAFAFYRRLRAKSHDVKPNVVDTLLRLGCLGLDACSRLIEDKLPWWHTANVPFQFSCILLAMDSHQSYTHLSQSIAVLNRAVEQFGTRMPRQALETVHFLVQLCQSRKQQDLALLAQCADSPPTTMPPYQPFQTPSNSYPSDLTEAFGEN